MGTRTKKSVTLKVREICDVAERLYNLGKIDEKEVLQLISTLTARYLKEEEGIKLRSEYFNRVTAAERWEHEDAN